MKNIKLVIILMGIILLCGCTTESVLEIDEATVNEVLTFDGETKDKDFTKEYIALANLVGVKEEYKIDKLSNGYRYSASFNIDEFSKDSITAHCFKNIKIEADKKSQNYIIEMENFDCKEELEQADKFTLKIKADGEIKECNNFSTSGDYLVWVFTEDNIPNVNCKISYGEGEEPTEDPIEEPVPVEEDPKPEIEEKPELPPKPEIPRDEQIKNTLIGSSIAVGFVLVIAIGMIVSAKAANKNR
jgi:hypothetical protein